MAVTTFIVEAVGAKPSTASVSKDDPRGCGGPGKKLLTDAAAAQIEYSPVPTTVAALRSLTVPPGAGPTGERQGPELQTFTLTVTLVGAKVEPDHDIHLIISDKPGSGTMIAELPDPTCPAASSSPHVTEMAAARTTLLSEFGPVPEDHHKALGGTAVVTGVGFFDDVHDQRGAASNGIELHPLLGFRLVARRPPDHVDVLGWHARVVGKWDVNRADVRLCSVPGRSHRARLVERSYPNRHVRAFSRSIRQTHRCTTTPFAWRFPADPAQDRYVLTIRVATAGADLIATLRHQR